MIHWCYSKKSSNKLFCSVLNSSFYSFLCVRSIHSVKGELVPHLVRRHGISTSTPSTQMDGKKTLCCVCLIEGNDKTKGFFRKWGKFKSMPFINFLVAQFTNFHGMFWSMDLLRSRMRHSTQVSHCLDLVLLCCVTEEGPQTEMFYESLIFILWESSWTAPI